MIDTYIKLLEDRGESVGLDSALCIMRKLDNKNCQGCETELGCLKLTKILEILRPKNILYTGI